MLLLLALPKVSSGTQARKKTLSIGHLLSQEDVLERYALDSLARHLESQLEARTGRGNRMKTIVVLMVEIHKSLGTWLN